MSRDPASASICVGHGGRSRPPTGGSSRRPSSANRPARIPLGRIQHDHRGVARPEEGAGSVGQPVADRALVDVEFGVAPADQDPVAGRQGAHRVAQRAGAGLQRGARHGQIGVEAVVQQMRLDARRVRGGAPRVGSPGAVHDHSAASRRSGRRRASGEGAGAQARCFIARGISRRRKRPRRATSGPIDRPLRNSITSTRRGGAAWPARLARRPRRGARAARRGRPRRDHAAQFDLGIGRRGEAGGEGLAGTKARGPRRCAAGWVCRVSPAFEAHVAAIEGDAADRGARGVVGRARTRRSARWCRVVAAHGTRLRGGLQSQDIDRSQAQPEDRASVEQPSGGRPGVVGAGRARRPRPVAAPWPAAHSTRQTKASAPARRFSPVWRGEAAAGIGRNLSEAVPMR